MNILVTYHRMTESSPEKFGLTASTSDLNMVLSDWNFPSLSGHPVGMGSLMEGAECMRHPTELQEWYELGVRLIGPAWVGTRYCGGWREPGPLTDDGRELLAAMAEYNFTLDLSHMDEPAAIEALDIYRGPIVATCQPRRAHANSNSNRHFQTASSKASSNGWGSRGSVFSYLVGSAKTREVRWNVANHIDHICQLVRLSPRRHWLGFRWRLRRTVRPARN